MRRAVAKLVEDGLLESWPQRGAFVSARLDEPDVLMGFGAMAAAKGLSVTSRVLRQLVRPASLDEADLLGIVPGSDLFELQRLRLLERLPVSVELNRIPLLRAPGVADVDYTTASLYSTLELTSGLRIGRADCTVEAVQAPLEIAQLLQVRPGFPLLLVEDTLLDAVGTPISWDRTLYRSDRYRFHTVARRAGDVAVPRNLAVRRSIVTNSAERPATASVVDHRSEGC